MPSCAIATIAMPSSLAPVSDWRRPAARRTTRSVSSHTPPGFLGLIGAVAAKDLRVELRSREILFTVTFFAAVMVVISSFAFVSNQQASRDAVPGVLWGAVMFAGTIGLGRAFEREREGDTLRALLLSPAPRLAIFLGKAVAVSALVIAVEIVIVPLTLLLFNLDLGVALVELAVVLALGALGFAVVGTVFATMLLRVRARDVLLPVVLYPILIPMFMAGTKATAALLVGADGDARFWTQFLAGYDAIFLLVALWTFEALVIE